MVDNTARTVRPLSAGMKRWFLIDSVLVAVTGVQLFVLTEYTNRFFAWTVNPPLTAAFLGASYWASFPLVYLASRQATWARARLAVYGVLAFTTLTTAATLIHLDRFHLSAPDLMARAAAWIWLAVYVIVPPSLLTLLIFQLRVPGAEPARQAPLSDWVRDTLTIHAVVMLVVGAVLFLAPLTPVWPWRLTSLTGRAVGSWLIGIGVIAAQMAWENDLTRVGPAMAGYAILGALQLVALARYATMVRWGELSASVYLAFAMSVLIIGGYGWMRSRKAT